MQPLEYFVQIDSEQEDAAIWSPIPIGTGDAVRILGNWYTIASRRFVFNNGKLDHVILPAEPER